MDYQATADALLARAHTYLSVFSTLDPNVLLPIQSSDFTHVFAPSSINLPPPMNKEQFAAHVTHIRELLSSFPVYAKKLWPNPFLNQVTIWADSETVFHDHVKDSSDAEEWSYRGEYIYILTFDSKAEKIEHVFEFLDSKGTERLLALMARVRKRKEDLDKAESEVTK